MFVVIDHSARRTCPPGYFTTFFILAAHAADGRAADGRAAAADFPSVEDCEAHRTQFHRAQGDRLTSAFIFIFRKFSSAGFYFGANSR